MSQQFVTLNNSLKIPQVGLGVYQTNPGKETYDAVLSALQLGYRHVDTAQVYQNEESVGSAVRDCGVPREDVWITTKLWRSYWGYDNALAAVKASLTKLGVEYIDLMLLHSPGDSHTRADTWRAMEAACKQGLCRSIGVSNFSVAHLEKLLGSAEIVPAVNQVEITPFLQRSELAEYCRSKGIVVEAYSPLSKGQKLSDPRLVPIADAHNVTPAQVMLRWSVQKGYVPLPKSVSPARQATNLDVFSFELTQQEMEVLDGMEEALVTGWDPTVSDPV